MLIRLLAVWDDMVPKGAETSVIILLWRTYLTYHGPGTQIALVSP